MLGILLRYLKILHNLPNSIYSVTIIDQNNPACTQDTSFEITQPQNPLSTAINLSVDIDCFGDSTGIAEAQSAIGGTFPYTYAWDNGQNTLVADSLWEGMHSYYCY